MPKFRKKPVVVDAWKYDGTDDCESMLLGLSDRISVLSNIDGSHIEIETLEGTMIANVGDWIIKGVKNEFYPCKPDIFAVTYEAVE